MTTLHGTLIALFELDLSAQGGGMYRFHNGSNEFGTDVVWQGNTYARIPVQVTGFEFSGAGKLPRPRLAVANVSQFIGGIARTYGNFIGCKITRRRTFAKYLDAANFINGNDLADPSAEFPLDIFFVEQMTKETKEVMEWELAAALDLEGVGLPNRQIIANVCPWVYMGAECGYVGGLPTCLKTLADCKTHFGANEELPFGGFAAAGLRRS
jgi:lambda family phage minor tail protein L